MAPVYISVSMPVWIGYFAARGCYQANWSGLRFLVEGCVQEIKLVLHRIPACGFDTFGVFRTSFEVLPISSNLRDCAGDNITVPP